VGASEAKEQDGALSVEQERQLRAIPDPLSTFEARRQHNQQEEVDEVREQWVARHFRLAASYYGLAREHEERARRLLGRVE
jgi:hypothetical protein